MEISEDFLQWAKKCKLTPGFRYYRGELHHNFLDVYCKGKWNFRNLSQQKFNKWLYDYAFSKFGGEPIVSRDGRGSYIEYIDYGVGVFYSYVNRIEFIRAVMFDGTRESALDIANALPPTYVVQFDFNTMVVIDGNKMETRVFQNQFIVLDQDGKYSIWEEEDFNNKYTLNKDRR